MFSTQSNSHSQSVSNNEKKELKNDAKIFAYLYISTQVRGGAMDELFSHETREYSLALAKNGEILLFKKEYLLSCLKGIAAACEVLPEVSGEVLHCAMIVNIAKPICEKTFKE